MTATAISMDTGRMRRFAAVLSGAGRVLGAAARLYRIRRNRAAILQLTECSDYMLHDIGVTRSELRSALGAAPLDDPSLRLGALADIRARQAAARRIG